MKGGDSMCDYTDRLYYDCHKIILWKKLPELLKMKTTNVCNAV